MSAAGGVPRIQAKLSACLEAGDYYEAHQMYRTLHFRLLAKNKYDELLELLYKGAYEFLTHGQQQSGVDLGILYIDVLVKSKTPVDKKIIEKVTTLFAKIDRSIAERDTYLNNAIRWSKGDNPYGDPLLHKNVAYVLWKEKSFQAAQQHFYNSDDGSSLAGLLVQMHSKQGSAEEIDIFVATAVLQILCKKKKQLARDTFIYYVGLHPDILSGKQPPFRTELLNFIWFLLEAIDAKNANVFKDLLVQYDSSIKRDSAYSEYLKKIGKIWFDITPPKSSHNGLLGNLIQTIFSGMEVDEGVEEEKPQPPPNKIQSEDVE